ncbi:ImmA/IrrE family metallo-endopeptidase [Frateuria sp. YIM B11624]|uniref:ImmA/IrrE family metallo-endopeptidase n=1 Tax=Frateuria sp. YIM B11624 TaxID=3143185 RepID=UPI003C7067D7
MTANLLQEREDVRAQDAPQALDWSRAQVSSLAEDVARFLDYKPGDALEPIVGKLGGTIEFAESDANEMNYGSIVAEGSSFTISLPLDSSPMRDRFTLAHELGHLVLHYLYPRNTLRREVPRMRANRFGSDQAEWEANWFAAAFLMPGEAFRSTYEELDGDIPAIANKFKVSHSAASVRAKSLKLPV